MVTEIAIFQIKPDSADAFVAAYSEGRALLEATPGCLGTSMVRGIESPSRFVLTVQWESLDAHVVGFRESDRFPQWRALIGPHFATDPHVEHYASLEEPGAPA